MYFRMLKKDLGDKVGLNIVLCIFMIIAATIVIMSAGFVITFFTGIERTYDKCKTTDAVFTVKKSFSDEEGQRRILEEALHRYPQVGDIIITESIEFRNGRMELEGVDRRAVTGLYEGHFLALPVRTDRNIPYNLQDETFTLSDGCVAISQITAGHAGSKVGDTFTLTTDMGNRYEFIISEIFKDPTVNECSKVLFSDHDYEVIRSESANLIDLYEFDLDHYSGKAEWLNIMRNINNDLTELSTEGKITADLSSVVLGKSNADSNEAAVTLIISLFMMILGVAMILLIFMSIRFSLRASIKREEKEIGTMKAIGVDSISYKTLFIVKYIAFAIFGAVAGLFAGIPLSKYMVSRFIYNTLNPDDLTYILISLLSGIGFVGLMILFSYLALRRINRISVMDTIHGENRGERFSKIPGFKFYKNRMTSVPSFLAIEDILRKTRRYVSLVLSYSLGLFVLFMIFQLKSTVVSDQYRRTYWAEADRELMIRPEDNIRYKLIEKTGSYRNTFEYYEKYFNENGIPLNIQIMDQQNGTLIMEDHNISVRINYGDYDMDRLTIVKGGQVPKLDNEVAITHYMKKLYGIDLGDTITLRYRVYQEDGFTEQTKEKDFIVTAYVESIGSYSNTQVYVNHPDDNMVMTGEFDIFNEGLDCSDNEYEYYIEKMRSLNEDFLIWDYDQVMAYDLGNEYGRILDYLAIVTGIIVALTVLSMTFLYQQIFIEEETSDIAMLKSLGIDRGSIRKWQYIRIILLVATAVTLAVVLSLTFSKVLFNVLAQLFISVGSFILVSPPVTALIGLPLAIVVLVSIVMLISFPSIDVIKIWKVRDE
ncbi:MAG: FtsX-like permease family protein [Lachnospiraceae bacterium]|nr:FtsX-like permease family protein [Lachnospiraceae bacterium]